MALSRRNFLKIPVAFAGTQLAKVPHILPKDEEFSFEEVAKGFYLLQVNDTAEFTFDESVVTVVNPSLERKEQDTVLLNTLLSNTNFSARFPHGFNVAYFSQIKDPANIEDGSDPYGRHVTNPSDGSSWLLMQYQEDGSVNQSNSDWTFAHELAHALRGHHSRPTQEYGLSNKAVDLLGAALDLSVRDGKLEKVFTGAWPTDTLEEKYPSRIDMAIRFNSANSTKNLFEFEADLMTLFLFYGYMGLYTAYSAGIRQEVTRRLAIIKEVHPTLTPEELNDDYDLTYGINHQIGLSLAISPIEVQSDDDLIVDQAVILVVNALAESIGLEWGIENPASFQGLVKTADWIDRDLPGNIKLVPASQ